MTRTDEVRERHELELANAALEDELVALKASGDDPDRLREVKHELRGLRQFWRGIREFLAPEVSDGDAVAVPTTIVASVDVKKG